MRIEMNNKTVLVKVVFVFLFSLTGCTTIKEISTKSTDDVVITPIPITSITSQSMKTETINLKTALQITSTSSPSLTPTPFWTTWTIEAPLPVSTAQAKVEEMLKTNGGCELPCWWGVEPGKTKFSSFVIDFSSLTSLIAIKEIDDKQSLIAEIKFPVSEMVSTTYLTHRYEVQNNIIWKLEVEPGDIDKYVFNQLLQDYKDPEEVWVEGIIDPSNNNPYEIYAYYPSRGILVAFGLTGTIISDRVHICPGSIPASFLILWEPEMRESFLDFAGKTYYLAPLQNVRNLLPLNKATNLSINEIMKQNCFDTPKNLWPTR